MPKFVFFIVVALISVTYQTQTDLHENTPLVFCMFVCSLEGKEDMEEEEEEEEEGEEEEEEK